jgi:hypothetical protein
MHRTKVALPVHRRSVYRRDVARRPRRRATIRTLAAALLVLSSFVAGPVERAAAATDRLPDLRAATIKDMRIERLGSRRVLRFTGVMWNQGAGPFETRASRPNRHTPWDVDQIVYDSAGGTRRVETDARMRYAGDGHDHWHVRQMLTYHLWAESGTWHDAKIGFCFFDTNLIDPDLPRSPSSKVYQQSSCGQRASLKTRNGISVGWGDKYPWNFAYQWIDITGLKGGTYTLRSAVDLFGSFEESDDTNNCTWARIKFGSSGSKVTVLDTGFSCPNDRTTSVYADDVAWALENDIVRGCGADMFCTGNPLTRGQLASWVANAYDLPEATKDWFTDDDGSPDEDGIDRAAEAGLVAGCGAGRYCPTQSASREQAAKLIALALDLPETATDYFDDDNGRSLERYVNRVAEAGFMTGCGERLFCPTRVMSRGGMTRALHLSLTPP